MQNIINTREIESIKTSVVDPIAIKYVYSKSTSQTGETAVLGGYQVTFRHEDLSNLQKPTFVSPSMVMLSNPKYFIPDYENIPKQTDGLIFNFVNTTGPLNTTRSDDMGAYVKISGYNSPICVGTSTTPSNGSSRNLEYVMERVFSSGWVTQSISPGYADRNITCNYGSYTSNCIGFVYENPRSEALVTFYPSPGPTCSTVVTDPAAIGVCYPKYNSTNPTSYTIPPAFVAHHGPLNSNTDETKRFYNVYDVQVPLDAFRLYCQTIIYKD